MPQNDFVGRVVWEETKVGLVEEKKMLCSWRGRGERVGVSVWRNNIIISGDMFSKKIQFVNIYNNRL